MNARWLRIGGTLMLGMFVSYIDRTNLSVSLPSVAHDLGFAGNTFATVSGWVLTAFLIGYIFANIFGGVFTSRVDPKKIAIFMMGLWSVSTLVTGMAQSVVLLVICRLVLGVAEGIYWPQQSRFVKLWFAPNELTRANSVIQYYGQFLALGLGFIILTPPSRRAGMAPPFLPLRRYRPAYHGTALCQNITQHRRCALSGKNPVTEPRRNRPG
ncbi:MFS transporter [Acerihabitans sp. KWT182]|uniref:MFS transporter n=1 Tax=Acerihabitans sp. KWT182 TaxID=3157919 RepID=A0AAU7Q693_9GAMM